MYNFLLKDSRRVVRRTNGRSVCVRVCVSGYEEDPVKDCGICRWGGKINKSTLRYLSRSVGNKKKKKLWGIGYTGRLEEPTWEFYVDFELVMNKKPSQSWWKERTDPITMSEEWHRNEVVKRHITDESWVVDFTEKFCIQSCRKTKSKWLWKGRVSRSFGYKISWVTLDWGWRRRLRKGSERDNGSTTDEIKRFLVVRTRWKVRRHRR